MSNSIDTQQESSRQSKLDYKLKVNMAVVAILSAAAMFAVSNAEEPVYDNSPAEVVDLVEVLNSAPVDMTNINTDNQDNGADVKISPDKINEIIKNLSNDTNFDGNITKEGMKMQPKLF
jgi:hypothetical protein